MDTRALDDQMDLLVAEYADRLAAGGALEPDDLLARVPAEHQPALERCLRMIRAGVASAPRTSTKLGPGAQLDGYRIVREIGRGGMSVVYLATQLDLARQVALKVLRPGLAIDGRHVDRFRREALSIARLQHPHIVQVYAVGEADGYHYLAMEHIDGKNLAQALADVPQATRRRCEREKRKDACYAAADLAEATGVAALARAASFETALAELLAPVARAIGVAHEIGLVHRDVKPSNILVHKDGRALIADFGLAKGDGDPGLSLTGEPLGTPYYMSPEQAALASAPIDPRTDVYSLGVTLYEALAGRRPFEGDTPLAVLDAIRSSAPPRLSQVARHVSAEFEAVVERAMARDPRDRYARALDLATDLAALADGKPTQARVQRKGEWRRVRAAVGASLRGQAVEYRSRAKLLGLPLVHWHFGPNPKAGKLRIAKAWLAVGDVAIGFASFGLCSLGVFSFGVFGVGVLAFASMALGVSAIGGVAAGVWPRAGVAVGYAPVGGVAIGEYAAGGVAIGAHVLTNREQDPAAVEYFENSSPWVLRIVRLRRDAPP
ncbi:MAG: serine/threonine-protein kinase [Planctomycetota bacterium]